MAKKESAPSRAERLKRANAAATRRDGVVFLPASELTNVHEERLDTGTYSLNKGTNGGYPCGKDILLAGGPGSGKDLTINLAIAACQRNKGNDATIAIIYTEGEWDKGFARLVGCKVSYSKEEIEQLEEKRGMKFSRQAKAAMRKEGVGFIGTYTANNAAAALDMMMDFAREGIFDIVVLNSIDGLIVPVAEEAVDEGSIADATKGRGGEKRAAMLSDFFRHKNNIMRRTYKISQGKKTIETPRKTVFFYISQFRMAHINKYVTTDKHISGGNAVKFYAGLILEISRTRGEETYMGVKKANSPDHIETSHVMNYHFSKGKYGCADGISIEFRYYKRDHYKNGVLVARGGTIDESAAIRASLAKEKFLTKRGTRAHILSLPNKEPIELPGARPLVDRWLMENPDIKLLAMDALNERLLQRVANQEEEGCERSEEEEEKVPEVRKESSRGAGKNDKKKRVDAN